MKRKRSSYRRSGVLIALYVALVAAGLLLLASVAPARAAEPTRGDAVAPVTQVDADGKVILVPALDGDSLKDLLSAAASEEALADQMLRDAVDLRSRASVEIEAKKKEIEAVKAKIKLAKEKKDDVEKKSLESTQKSEELMLKLLERLSEMRDQEKACAEATRDMARAEKTRLDRRRDLDESRREREHLLAGEMTEKNRAKLGEVEKTITELTKKALEASREAESRREELAKRAKDLADRRLKVLEAQLAL